jgi:hypothetical protein
MSGPHIHPLPSIIDSTILVRWRACAQAAALEFMECLSPGESVHLRFGGALAAGLEAARKGFFLSGLPAREAENLAYNAASDYWGDFLPPDGSAKNWGTLLLALEGYFKMWPIDSDPVRPIDGKFGIEFTFAHPIPEVLRPDWPEPFVYGGRFDLLGSLDGMLCILDEKTTGKGFGGTWSKGWTLRNQFMGYVWAARHAGFDVQQVIVRGISIQKTKIDYAPAIASYPPHLIDRWYAQLVHDLTELSRQWSAGYFPYNFGETCTAFGGCAFTDVCPAKEWYGMFQKRTWNPLAKDPEVGK